MTRNRWSICRNLSPAYLCLGLICTSAYTVILLSNQRCGAGNTDRRPELRTGIIYNNEVVVPGRPQYCRLSGELIECNLTAQSGMDDQPRVISYMATQSRFLNDHPWRLQASFGLIWQVQLESVSIHDRYASGLGTHCVDTTPSVKVDEAAGRVRGGQKDIVIQRLSRPPSMISLSLATNYPHLREYLDKSTSDTGIAPVLFYDFAITNLEAGSKADRSEPSAKGILFLLHRYEPDRFILATPFPVGPEGPRWERIVVPFSEPFHCAIDANDNYYFVTDSGQLYLAPKARGGAPRGAKPLLGEPAWRAKVLLRDADTGVTTVFAQNPAAPSGRDVMVRLAPGADPQRLPAGFFAELEGKSTPTVLWKCAELSRGKR